MTDKTVLLQDLEAYTEEEKYYIRCLELQQPPKPLSFFDAFPDDQTRVFMERHPRFAPCPPHTHEFFEIFYVMTGTCGQQLDDRHFLLHQGDVGFLAPGSVHTLEITDERNALERAMLQFSYLAKRTERIGEKTFRMTLRYRQEDETELLIKIISFGPLVKVVEPDSFASRIRERIGRQFQYDFA